MVRRVNVALIPRDIVELPEQRVDSVSATYPRIGTQPPELFPEERRAYEGSETSVTALLLSGPPPLLDGALVTGGGHQDQQAVVDIVHWQRRVQSLEPLHLNVLASEKLRGAQVIGLVKSLDARKLVD